MTGGTSAGKANQYVFAQDVDITFFVPETIFREAEHIAGESDYQHPVFSWGVGCWVLKTYYELSKKGVRVGLSSVIPDRGIVIAHRGSLPSYLPPSNKRFLVSIRADRAPHPFSQAEIIQNPRDARRANTCLCFHLPHWPQHGIIRRSPLRPPRLQSLYYFGTRGQMARELHSDDWQTFLAGLGVAWRIIDAKSHLSWGDYSECDATVAIRDFGRRHIYKPATKVYNTWIGGGVPISGGESSHIALGGAGVDFPVARDYPELKELVALLVHDPGAFESYRRLGEMRAKDFSTEAIAEDWLECLRDQLVPAYHAWQAKGAVGLAAFAARGLMAVPGTIVNRAAGAAGLRWRRVIKERRWTSS